MGESSCNAGCKEVLQLKCGISYQKDPIGIPVDMTLECPGCVCHGVVFMESLSVCLCVALEAHSCGASK